MTDRAIILGVLCWAILAVAAVIISAICARMRDECNSCPLQDPVILPPESITAAPTGAPERRVYIAPWKT